MKVGTWIARVCLAICVGMIACGGGATGAGETLGATTEALGTSTMSILIPAGVNIGDIALGAMGILSVNDRAQVQRPGGGAVITNMGLPNATQGTSVGADSAVGVAGNSSSAIYSQGQVTLRSRAHVYGSITTNAIISKQDNTSVVTGTSLPNASLVPQMRTWAVNFPASNQGPIPADQNSNTPPPISPGSFGDVTLHGGVSLTLSSSGTYYFRSLDLEPQSHLVVAGNTGPTIIYVLNSLIYRGTVSGTSDVLLGYLGSAGIFIENAFRGTVVSPEAKVDVASLGAPGFIGSIFARSIEIHEGTLVTHQPFPWALLPSGLDAAGFLAGSVVPTDQTQAGITVGTTPGSFAVSSDGAATYSIPLWTPAAREGIGPELAFNYNSRGGWGNVGVGWSLGGMGISRISRCAATFAQDGKSQSPRYDRDVFCIDGARMVPINGTSPSNATEYRTERDQHLKIMRAGSGTSISWEVRQRDGRISKYGSSAASRLTGNVDFWQADTTTTAPPTRGAPVQGTMAWALDRVSDRVGNYMMVSYRSYTSGIACGAPPSCTLYELEPDRIDYTFGVDQPALRSVQFIYQVPDQSPHFMNIGGVGLMTSKLLQRIEMRGPAPLATGLLRSYNLQYKDASNVSNRPLLLSLQECDGQTPSVCKPKTTFDWDEGSNLYSDISLGSDIIGDIHGLGTVTVAQSTKRPVFSTLDLDGDGRDDLLIGLVDTANGTSAPSVWVNALATAGSPGFGPVSEGPAEDGIYFTGVRPVDLNMDGVPEMVVRRGATFKWKYLKRSNGSYVPAYSVPDSTASTEPNISLSDRMYIGDLDGDGLAEVVRPLPQSVSDPGTWAYRPNLLGVLQPYLNLAGDGNNAVAVSDDWNAYLVNVDGSSKTNFLTRTASSTRYMIVDPTGDGSNATSTTLEAGTKNDNSSFHYFFADLNGDGFPEALRIANGNVENDAPQLLFNTGRAPGGFSAPFAPPATLENGSFRYLLDQDVAVGDFDEDGVSDLLFTTAGADGSLTLATFSLSRSAQQLEPRSVPRTANGPIVLTAIDRVAQVPPNPPVKKAAFARTLDVNGDGLTDILAYAGGYHLYVRQGKKADQLIHIRDGLGAHVDIDYENIIQGSTRYTPGTDCREPQICVKRGVWVVANYTVSNDLVQPPSVPLKDFNQFTYTYQDARSDTQGRGFLGFNKVKVKNEQTGTTVETTYDNHTRFSQPTSGPNVLFYPYAGLVQHRKTSTPLQSGSTHRDVETDTQFFTRGPQRGAVTTGFVFAPLAGTVTLTESEGGTQLRSFTTVNAYSSDASNSTPDEYDNLISSKTTSATGFVTTKTTQYMSTTAASWLISVPTLETDTRFVPPSVTQTRTVQYVPDSNTGLYNQIIVEPNDGNQDQDKSTTTFERTVNGQVFRTTVDAEDTSFNVPFGAHPHIQRQTTMTYDSIDSVYPSSVTNNLSQTTQLVYHGGLGVLVASQAPNGLATTYQYDGFGRARHQSQTGAGDVTVHYEAPPPRFDSFSGARFTVHTKVDGGGESLVTYNLLGDELARDEKSSNGQFSVVTTGYTPIAHQVNSIVRPHHDHVREEPEPARTTRPTLADGQGAQRGRRPDRV